MGAYSSVLMAASSLSAVNRLLVARVVVARRSKLAAVRGSICLIFLIEWHPSRLWKLEMLETNGVSGIANLTLSPAWNLGDHDINNRRPVA